MSSTRPPIWVVLRTHFVAQPRKAAVLVILAVVMVIVYLRLFLKDGGTASAEASAALPTPAQVEAAPLPSPPVKRFQPERPLVRDLSRDPFLVQLDRFKVDPDAVIPPEPQATSIATQPAAAGVDLLLSGTVCGATRMAWINGRCVHQGEEIGGYVLEQIEPTQVTLLRDGVRRVLTME